MRHPLAITETYMLHEWRASKHPVSAKRSGSFHTARAAIVVDVGRGCWALPAPHRSKLNY